MTKESLKISGCLQSIDGARYFANIRSVITTAGKQDWNVLERLVQS